MRVYGLAMNPADLDAIEKMLRVTYLAPGIADAFAKLRKERDRFADMLFARGAMDQAPCFNCGYNGAGYYTPKTHACAARYHAAVAQLREGEGK